jgi:hypothetical protein
VENLVTMKSLHTQNVVVGRMKIPLSVIRVGDVIHCHTIVVGTANPQCRHEHPFVLGRTLVSLWEDSGNALPSVNFDVVPQPAVHKRSGIIFDHFCPQELFALPYSGHVFGLEFVLGTDRLRFISACPKCVLLVPLGKPKNGFATGTGSRIFHLLHIISPVFTLFLITGSLVSPIVVGLEVGHGDT